MTANLTAETDLLLKKLGSDDAFRAHLLRDPHAALASIGVHLAPGDIPATVRLPSKQAITRDRMDLLDKLDSAAGAIPFLLSGKL